MGELLTCDTVAVRALEPGEIVLRHLSKLAVVALLAAGAGAGPAGVINKAPASPVTHTASGVSPSLFKALQWRSLGPYRGKIAVALNQPI